MSIPDNGTPASDAAAPDPIEQLRAYVLQRMLRGVPRTAIEEELIAHGYDVQYALTLVDSVRRSAEKKAMQGALPNADELPAELPPVGVNEVQEQLAAMAEFTTASRTGAIRPRYRVTATTRAFFVLSIIGGPLLVVGLATEYRFWFLWVTGARATATITRSEDQVILRPYGPSNVRKGGYELKATLLDYTFPTSEGPATGSVLLDSTSKEWAVGMPVEVMYSRFDASANAPSSLSFYWEHDTVWFMANFAAGIGLILLVIGIVGGRRKRELHKPVA